MVLPRAESIASSAGVNHGLESLNLRDGVIGADYDDSDILQAPSLESGVFGVLYTLSQEKNQQHIYYHWILLKIMLDAWQIYTTIMSPEMGWNINPNGIVWKCVSVLSFGWMKDLGYPWYIAVLYSMAGLLAVNLVLCVWVAWSFKEQKFNYVWPIKVVRGFSYVFLQVFDITSLNFLQLGISCNYVGPAKPHLHMATFPQYSCSTTPHIIHALVSGLLLLLFVAVAMLLNMSEVDVNPTSKTPQALGHSGAEVTAFGIKALMTLVGVFLGWPKVAAIAYMLLAAWLVWVYLRWVPHLLTWVNCLKGGVAVAMLYVATLQLGVALLPRSAAGPGGDAARTLTLVMAIGLGPLFLLGAVGTYLRTKLFTAAVIKAFKTTDPEAVKPQDVYHFAHPRDVEVAARCARVWTDLYTLEKSAVHRAEEIIKAGVALFPDSAFVALVYANFMLDMLGFSQTGARQLESVRKLSPGLMCRFMLFVRQQQATQKAASSTVGKGGNMDLLGYVEYQRKQRMVLRHHKDALQAMANFWRILGASSISFSSLSKSLEEIDTSISQAETAYRVVLELYNNSPRLVRLYARFLETIKQDPWTAAQYHAAAERLEENKDEDGQGPTLPDGTPISRMDDVEKGVVVVNAFGDIQVANRKLHNIFGYKKGDLDGKNVTVLMPPHEAKRHPAILRRYIDSGDKAAPYFKHPVLAVHRERVAFTVRIAVSRASGLGEDSVFIGLIEALPSEPGVGRVWVTPEGVIVCCDPGFVTCFGYHPEDVIGVQLDKLLRTGGSEMDRALLADIWMASKVKHDNQEYVQKLLASATTYSSSNDDALLTDPQLHRCSVLHKYDFAKEVLITVRSDMTKSSIFEARMKLMSDEPQLLMVVERKGAIRHMSGDLAKVLGVGVGEGLQIGRQGSGGEGSGACKADYDIADDHVMMELVSDGVQHFLDDFLPPPWKVMHYKYRKYVKGGSSMLSGAWGCRGAGAGADGNSAGPTMQLVGVHGKPVYVHVAVSSRDSQGEVTHVVRMTRSSKEQAISERRLRLRITEDGVVQEVLPPGGFDASAAQAGGGVPELFGFPAEQLLGCKLWDFMSLASQPAAGGGGRQMQGQLQLPGPAQSQSQSQQICDFIAEAEAVVGGTGLSTDGSDGRRRAAATRADNKGMDVRMLGAMITSTLQTPGVSWRVNVVPPSVAVEVATMGSAERAAAVLARRTKQAVLRLDVTLPPPGSPAAPGSGQLLVAAELWAAEAVTGVLEVDGAGRVTGVLEEEVRPPGLLFGLPKEDIVGAQLGTLLRLLPGQSPVGLLTDSGIAKKSALKTSSRKGKVVDKVGPVHYLDGFHRDHQPLSLAVQVVGKPGPGNPVIAVIRLASPTAPGRRSLKRPNPSAPAVDPGQSAPRAHVSLSFCGNEQALALPSSMSQSQQPLLLPQGSSGGGGVGPPLKLRETSFSRSGAGGQLATGGSSKSLLRGATTQRPSGDGKAAELLNGGGSGDGANADAVSPSPPLAATTSVAKLSFAGRSGTDGGSGSGAAAAAATAVSVPLPGAAALASGVACLISSRSLQETGSGGSRGTAAVAAAAVAAAAAGAAGSSATGSSSPPKPESPPVTGPTKRPTISPRTGAGLGLGLGEDEERPPSATSRALLDKTSDSRPPKTSELQPKGSAARGDGLQGAGPGGPTLVSSIKAQQETDGSSDDPAVIGGVDKWVASGGQFFKNRAPSVMDADLDVDDDEDEDGSFGATSRATSSHWISPTSSRNLGDGPDDAPPSYMQHHHQQQQQQQQQQQLLHRRGPAGAAGGGGGGGGGNGGWVGLSSHPPDVAGPDGGLRARGPGGGGGGGGDTLALAFGGPDGGFEAMDALPAALGPGPPPEDVPDDRSDGGESAYSAISGVSGVSDSETPADFQRGKRYRKLVKLMDSPEAQRTVVLMRLHTALTMLAACSIHIVCFALVITAIKSQSRAVDQLAAAGDSQVHLQRVLVETRALDQAYNGRGSNTTYDFEDVQLLGGSVMIDCQEFRNINNDLLSQVGGNIEGLYYTREIEVWSGINATTKLPYYQNMTLWDLVTRVFVSAKTVYQNHADWYKQGLNVSSTLAGAFLLNSGEALIPGLCEVLNALVDVAIRRTNTVNVLQLVFLILEGFLVTVFVAFILVYILRSVCDQRYQLYETFLKIPVGLTRALASQTTHLLDDDESDDDEDEDGSQMDNNGEEGSLVPKRRTLFDEGNGTGAGGTHGPMDNGGGEHGGRGGAAGARGGGGRQRRSSVGPSSSGGGSGYKLRQNDDSARALLVNAAANRARGGGGSTPPQAAHHPHLSSGTGMVGLNHRYSLSASINDRDSHKTQGWLGRLVGKLWRGNAVSPMPSPSTGVHDVSASRRTLERNSRIPQATLLFIGTYSLLVIFFYSVSYGILLGVRDMVALQAVAEHTTERTYRSVFFAQELVAEEDMTRLPPRVEDLRGAAVALRDAYYTLRMGAYAWTAVGPGVERFPQVRGRGSTKESPAMFDLFYTDNACLRLPSHGPCPPSTDRFFQIIRSGVDGMTTQMLLELKTLVDEAEASVTLNASSSKPSATSPSWDFIYNVGTVDLFDGNLRIVTQHIEDVREVFNTVVVLHVVLLLLLLGVFLAFLMIIYLPLLRRMSKEKRRIAEMMSQLPAELDVMKLVSAALVGPKPAEQKEGQHHRRHHLNRMSSSRRARGGGDGGASPGAAAAAAGGVGGAMVLLGDPMSTSLTAGGNGGGGIVPKVAGESDGAAGGGSKAYQTWKDILNRATNVNSATRQEPQGAVAATTKRPVGRV